LDPWSYEDPECQKILQKYWWLRTSPILSFSIGGEEEVAQEVQVRKISQAILDSTPSSISVHKGSFLVDYFVQQIDKTWYLGAFTQRGEPDDSRSSCIAVTPTNTEIFDHIMNWVAIQLS
jgi:hypothetical protein